MGYHTQYRKKALPHFTWFVEQGPTLMIHQKAFPNVFGILYGTSTSYPILYHIILTVSKYFVDISIGLNPPYVHLANVIPKIRGVIATYPITRGHIFAVVLLVTMYTYGTKFGFAVRYLHGLSLMIDRAEILQWIHDEAGPRPVLMEFFI